MSLAEVDGFGLWPHFASGIIGLKSGVPHPKSTFAFHTNYMLVDGSAKEVSFRVVIKGLRADAGMLDIQLQSSSGSRRSARVEQRHRVRLNGLATHTEVSLRFKPRADRFYAVKGSLSRSRNVAADALVITLDHPLGQAQLEQQLVCSRSKIFAGPTALERLLRLPSSRVEKQGLVSHRRATLAEPVSQMCTSSQLQEPEFFRWMEALHEVPMAHRKQWEFAYILSSLEARGYLRKSSRGLGFGVGNEPLSALMAACGCSILATDLPSDRGASDWIATNQHAQGLGPLWREGLVDAEVFQQSVRFRSVDMRHIPDDIGTFDFCWSACAFEHLGSISEGLHFISESLKYLRPGGLSVHTTELNLNSNSSTLDNAGTVLFRKIDFERLALALASQGHEVAPLCWDQGSMPVDQHVDVPPYTSDPHLKLSLSRFVTTSFGIAITRGVS